MKKIGFYLAHPAHFHLFKNVIYELSKQNQVFVVYNDKDVLHELINSSSFSDKSYRIKTNSSVNSKIALYIQFALKNWGAFKIFFKLKPSIVIGTPILVSLLSRILPFKSIIVNEDDFDIIKKTADFGYPYADHILCPVVCRTSNFASKCIKYNSYHELAYLHPDHFTPDKEIATKYVDLSKPYFIIRFAKLFAHHDDGINGINNEIANRVVELLKPHGNIYITSERPIESDLEKYRISINAKDMHHVMSFAKIYIGDSQTMAAESGVLGVPFIRFNDFVGRISYLDELENTYELGFGIKTENVNELYQKIQELNSEVDLQDTFFNRKQKMLSDKINYAVFLIWFIQNYPESVELYQKNPDYRYEIIP